MTFRTLVVNQMKRSGVYRNLGGKSSCVEDCNLLF